MIVLDKAQHFYNVLVVSLKIVFYFLLVGLLEVLDAAVVKKPFYLFAAKGCNMNFLHHADVVTVACKYVINPHSYCS